MIGVVISSVSFVLWVYATGGTFPQLPAPTAPTGIIPVAIGVWTFLIPYVYKGEERPQDG